jgi:dodecin
MARRVEAAERPPKESPGYGRSVETMAVAKVTEITSSSKESFDDAVRIGIARANKTLQNIKEAWIQEQKVKVEGGKVTEYRGNMKVTFVLKD